MHISGIRTFSLLFTLVFLVPWSIFPCTIVSAIAPNGHVWNMNNEDGPYGVANFINVFPRSANAKYGYYTLSYFSPELGMGGSMQGGMNEAGLTFDFNAIDRVHSFDPAERIPFPQGNDAILPHILSSMSTVEEVMDFFSTYWFQNGFMAAQMHVADRQGSFAIISASGMKLVAKGQPLVSTNFNICGKEDSSSCWRYPIATKKLRTEEVGLMSMMSIARETAQKKGQTMYTNIQNISTGEVWLFSKHDPDVLVHTNMTDLLSKGRRSYTFSDLNSVIEERPKYTWKKPKPVPIPGDLKAEYSGKYHNSFTGNITVRSHSDGLEMTFEDGRTELFYSHSENKYFIADTDVHVEFSFDEMANRMAMNLYQDGDWSFRAWIVQE